MNKACTRYEELTKTFAVADSDSHRLSNTTLSVYAPALVHGTDQVSSLRSKSLLP